MGSKLIKLKDNIVVEVETSEDDVQPIAWQYAKEVEGTFSNIKNIIMNVCQSVLNTWKEIKNKIDIEKAEVELGIKIEGEGNFIIAKSKTGAHLAIKLTIKPTEE